MRSFAALCQDQGQSAETWEPGEESWAHETSSAVELVPKNPERNGRQQAMMQTRSGTVEVARRFSQGLSSAMDQDMLSQLFDGI